MMRPITPFVLAVGSLSGVIFANYAAAVSVSDIIDNVQQYEQIYDDVDVRMRESYKFTGQPPRDDDPGVDDNYALRLNHESVIHFVRQSGKFHVEINCDKKFDRKTPGEIQSDHRIRKFDGAYTRLLKASTKGVPGIGHVIDEAQQDYEVVFPHMFLVRNRTLTVRFSTLLQGHEALAAETQVALDSRAHLNAEYIGETDRDGLHCQMVRLTEDFDGEPRVRRVFWLASERNYIPVYQEEYDLQMSKDIPKGVGEVTEWKEIEPGVWFPIASEITLYDTTLLSQGTRKVSARYFYFVEAVSLDPNYEPSFFSNLTFPDRTAVYHLSNGEITNSYLVGAPEIVVQSDWWRSLIFWGNACAIVALVAAIVVRHKRRATA